MSDRDYIAWSLALAGLFGTLFGASVTLSKRRQRGDQPREVKLRFAIVNMILAIILAVGCGFTVMNLLGRSIFGITPPKWSEALNFWWIPIMGVQQLLTSFESKSERPVWDRVYGTLMLLVGIFIVSTSISKA